MSKEVVGVVGAGLMGAEIALTFALVGHEVLLSDRDQPTLDHAVARLAGLAARGVDRGLFNASDIGAAKALIKTTLELADFARADFVTEAVSESLEIKTAVLQALDNVCPRDCVITTNTSSIPISTLATALRADRRANFVGTHYFSPVTRMKLVEVIPGFDTSRGTVGTAFRLCVAAGKQPIEVKDVAGFAVNRMLHAFLIEAVRLVEEGVATPADLDTACRLGLGHPLGPFELMDAVTSSLCVQAQEIMQEAYGERFRPPQLLKQRVRAGLVGGKGKPGWRSHA